MSQLRKSASFRSRIPIRRSNISNRRCCSPPPRTSSNNIINDNGSIDHQHKSSMPQKRSRRSHKSRNFLRRYSSSSYSSSDESFISDQPIKKKINNFHPNPEFFYTSNDALSLNALLDSVSSGGTFSSPPSPIQQIYGNSMVHHSSESYESLDRYDIALEKLRITDNLNHIGVKLPYPPHDETRRVHQKFLMSNNLNPRQDIKIPQQQQQQQQHQQHFYENKYGSDPNLKKVKQLKDDWYNLRNRENFNNQKRTNNKIRMGKRIDENVAVPTTNHIDIKKTTSSGGSNNVGNSRHNNQGHRMKRILNRMPNSLLSSQDEISILPTTPYSQHNNNLNNLKCIVKKQLIPTNQQHNSHLYSEHAGEQQKEQKFRQHLLNSSNSIVKRFNHKRKELFSSQNNNNNNNNNIISMERELENITLSEQQQQLPPPSSPATPSQLLNIKESPGYLLRMSVSRDHIDNKNENDIVGSHGRINANLKVENFNDEKKKFTSYQQHHQHQYQQHPHQYNQQYYWKQTDESQSYFNDDTKERDTNVNNCNFDFPIPPPPTSSAFDGCYAISEHLDRRQPNPILYTDSYKRRRNGVFWFTSSHSNSPDEFMYNRSINGSKDSVIQQQQQQRQRIPTDNIDEPPEYYNETKLSRKYYCNDENMIETLKIRTFENDNDDDDDDFNMIDQNRNRSIMQQQQQQQHQQQHKNKYEQKTTIKDADCELYTTFNQENYKNMCRNMAVNSFQKRNNKNKYTSDGIKIIPGQQFTNENFSTFNDTTTPPPLSTLSNDNKIKKKMDVEEWKQQEKQHELKQRIEIVKVQNSDILMKNDIADDDDVDVDDADDDVDAVADDCNDCDVDNFDNNTPPIQWYKANENFWQLKKPENRKKQKMTTTVKELEKIKKIEKENNFDEENIILLERDDNSANRKFNKATKQIYYDNDMKIGGMSIEENDNNIIDIDNVDDGVDDNEMYYQNIEETYNMALHHQNQHNENNLNVKYSKYPMQLKHHHQQQQQKQQKQPKQQKKNYLYPTPTNLIMRIISPATSNINSQSISTTTTATTTTTENDNQYHENLHFQNSTQEKSSLTQFVNISSNNNNNNNNDKNNNLNNSNNNITNNNNNNNGNNSNKINNENGLFQQLNIIGIPTTNPYLDLLKNNNNNNGNSNSNSNSNNINNNIGNINDNKKHFHNEKQQQQQQQINDIHDASINTGVEEEEEEEDGDITEMTEFATDRTRTPTNCGTELAKKYLEAKRRPLPKIPLQDEIFPPKSTTSYRSECELSGSYVSLECPSPPGPPACLPESRRDPQARLSNYLKTLYTDLALKEPIIPPWAIPVAPGALSPARLEPEIRLNAQSHGFTDCLSVDQLLLPIHTKDGNFLEAPRRVLIECPPWASRSNLALRILHGWAREPPWPPKGTPIAMALLIPLMEIKRSFANYVEKELILKGPMNPFANGFGGFTTAWNSLETLGPKLLFVLDGYDNQRGSPKRKGKQYPPDVHDLLDGKIFPEARVIITTSISNCNELLPLIQRHVTFDGLTWGRSASLLGGGQWGAAPSRLLDTVQECPPLRKIVRTPLGCLAVAAIFEATAGDLPTEELDVIESVLNCIAPETSSINVAELGRLMLFCLKMKRPCITMSELRMYCSSPESNMLGCLDKSLLLGKSARKKGEFIYGPMCPNLAEFLAANYIASLANRPGLLSAEITGLTIGDELDPDMLKVIKYAMGLLGPRSHVLLSKLTPLWLSPQTIFSLALAGGNSEDNLASLCDILGISKHPPISPLESKPLWVQVRSAPTELMGWGMALKSHTCTLKNLELIYQLEKHHLLDARSAMEIFLDSLDMNESVSTLRITSLIENEVKDSEIGYLGSCVAKALTKPRLESFELILTLLEEDPPILKLQPVVSALCRSIPRQPKLNCLQLDLGLSTSQLVQLCSVLDKCPNITRLSLPHLRCERGAVTALATLLAARPLNFLSIPSCWGARDDPPSSSGVSMGSGSGSSTGTSGLIKQGSLTGVPSPRAYPPGLFSSLPRGMYVPTATMGRSATLPRQPIEPPPDKRSCDSVVSKTWYPTPACDGGPHSSGTLHDLLLAAREPYSKLHGLDLSKAQLSLEDSMCLGETVRLSNTLHTLKLEGSSRLSEILPSVLGASESPCLQMLSIGSPRLNLEDSVIAMSARSLTSCTTLRLLSLDGWSFRIEIPSTLSILRAFLSLTSIRELSLANCRLQIGIFKSDSKIINPFESRSVVVLKLASAQVSLGDSTVWKGPQLLPIISGFPCLRELDLSAPARSGLGSTTHSTPLIIDDKCLITFFQSLHTHFSLLNTLKICNWVIHFDDPTKTLKMLSKSIRNSPISHLKLDGISVLDRAKKLRIESGFLHCFISSLPLLRWMGISLSGKKEDQITAIGNAVLDLKGYEIDIKLSESTIEHAKLMAQAISLDGKFDIKVSTFGTSSGILIHAEKSGTKSLNRKNNKD